MKSLLRSAVVIAAMASAAGFAPGAATAGVSIAIGIPPVVVGTNPGYVAYDEQYYYDPIYITGAWYHGPYRWRMRGGERVFFVNGGWHRNEWHEGRLPESMEFRNGGSFREGRYDGFDGAERINARFHVNAHDAREAPRDLTHDRADMQHGRKDMQQEREDKNDARHNDGESH